jgi:hypothetical protein
MAQCKVGRRSGPTEGANRRRGVWQPTKCMDDVTTERFLLPNDPADAGRDNYTRVRLCCNNAKGRPYQKHARLFLLTLVIRCVILFANSQLKNQLGFTKNQRCVFYIYTSVTAHETHCAWHTAHTTRCSARGAHSLQLVQLPGTKNAPHVWPTKAVLVLLLHDARSEHVESQDRMAILVILTTKQRQRHVKRCGKKMRRAPSW